MAAQTVAFVLRSGSDAEFRIWGKAISDQMAAGGWVQTADSSQVNWTTVTAPAGADTVAGYEMWRSDDETGSLNEIYVKLEYGSHTTAANQPAVWITVGFASDGSGAITGTAADRFKVSIGATASASSVNNRLAAGGGVSFAGDAYIAMFLGTAASLNFYFSIERLVDSSLAKTDDILFIANQYNGTTRTQVVNPTTAFVAESTGGAHIPTAANAIVDGEIGLGLWRGQKGGFTAPSRNIFGVANTTAGAEGGTVNITTLGEAKVYVINTPATANVHRFGASTSTQCLSRFE